MAKRIQRTSTRVRREAPAAAARPRAEAPRRARRVRSHLITDFTIQLSTLTGAGIPIVKALGTGFGPGIWIRDVGVLHNDWGRPEVIFSTRGKKLCEQLGAGAGFVSLSDEAGFAMAFAVLERR